MKLRLFMLLFGCGVLFTSNVVEANTCSHLASTINRDINTQHKAETFPWMKLSWLESKLGKKSPQKTVSGQTEYHWSCHDADGTSITASTDSSGNMINVSGKYNNGANGAGIFSTCDNCITKIEASDSPSKPATTPDPVQPSGAADNTSTAYNASKLVNVKTVKP
jgi:hypothetical protein